MHSLDSPAEGGLFRLWITTYADDWHPGRWNDPPPQATAVELVADTTYSAAEARLFVEGFNSQIATSDKPLWVRRLPLLSDETLAQWDNERANSQRELLAIDDGILAILDKLQAMGEMDNTIFIFVADQGFSWGSHRWIYKNCPYVECSNFPLLIRVPGGENRVESRLVSNVDLAPTIADLAGAPITGRKPDGRSLVTLLTDPAAAWAEEQADG